MVNPNVAFERLAVDTSISGVNCITPHLRHQVSLRDQISVKEKVWERAWLRGLQP